MSEIDYTKHWDAVIDKRNRRLQASDWTQIPDSPLTDAKKSRVGYVSPSSKRYASARSR